VGQFQEVGGKVLHAVPWRGSLGEPADLEVQVARVAEEPTAWTRSWRRRLDSITIRAYALVLAGSGHVSDRFCR
jgi:hypothetical protein